MFHMIFMLTHLFNINMDNQSNEQYLILLLISYGQETVIVMFL